MASLSKEFLLNDSKSFCMFPWVHLSTTPAGVAQPCCVAKPIGNTNNNTIIEIVNSEKMSNLRNDMLNDIRNPICSTCHKQEDNNVKSFRHTANHEYATFFDEVIENTNTDGTLNDFKMRYFDIRFSNICNFKCRTCNSEFSSQWEQEDKKFKSIHARDIPKNNSEEFIAQVLTHIPHLQCAYFAGGEPLITEEHYLLLEEMIRLKKNDVILRYNTNLSNLKFKDKDLLSLWKNFKSIQVSASIDHYGKRAEYIRHGTNWETVEENLYNIKPIPYIRLQVHTVLNIYNYLTLNELYQYLIDKNLYGVFTPTFSIYTMSTPRPLSALALPKHLKAKGEENIKKLLNLYDSMGMQEDKKQQLINAVNWVNGEDCWEECMLEFYRETKRLDKIRNENFVNVFPELAELMDL